MKILIVDDENRKVVEISEVLRSVDVASECVTVATAASSALKLLKEDHFDLLIIDMFLPMRLGEVPNVSGGVELLNRIHRDKDIHPPEHILGLSSNLEALDHSKDSFAAFSWFLEEVSPSKTTWKLRLAEKIQYLRAREEYVAGKFPVDITRPPCDVLFVCALVEPELSELHKLTGEAWQSATYPGDPHIYWRTEINTASRRMTAVSISLPQMGLVAAGVATAKAIALFKPKIVVMTGICGGRRGDCALGDLIGATLTWDYGSGKFTDVGGTVEFEPAPFQAAASARVNGVLAQLSTDQELIQAIYQKSPGFRPESLPKFHPGPLASGAAVQNHKEFFNGVANQQRKIIGIDMEAFAVAWACHEAHEPQPHWLVIKAVVDFADGTKDSRMQAFGSYASASFALAALERLNL